MALKLKVHWREEHLEVNGVRDEVIRELADCARHSHVRQSGSDVLVERFFGVNNVVPDVSRYCIGVDGCCAYHDSRYRVRQDRYVVPHCDVSGRELRRQLSRCSLLQLCRRRTAGNIVLLLESPHKDEYRRSDVSRPIAPASGTTGDNIDRCLATALSRINEQELIAPGCHVIIANPIQFQTSLHAIHGRSTRDRKWGELRDHVWKALWNEGDQENYIRRCFRTRLSTYRPSVVINACTGNLKKYVKRCLGAAEFQNARLYETDHPSYRSWSNCDVHPTPVVTRLGS